jgi:hypothetical protein
MVIFLNRRVAEQLRDHEIKPAADQAVWRRHVRNVSTVILRLPHGSPNPLLITEPAMLQPMAPELRGLASGNFGGFREWQMRARGASPLACGRLYISER